MEPTTSNRLYIYMKPEERAALAALGKQLAAQGVAVLDNRGHVSLSAVIRHLVAKELTKPQ